MRFWAEQEIETCVSSKRSNFANVRLDVERRVMEATDGHMAVRIGVEIEEGDIGGLVSPCALTAARGTVVEPDAAPWAPVEPPPRVSLKALARTLVVNEAEPMLTFTRPDAADVGTFPPVENLEVIPKHRAGDAGTVTLALDAALLATIAKALGSNGVLLTFRPGKPMEPFVVERDWADGEPRADVGALMPRRPCHHKVHDKWAKDGGMP